MGTTERVLTVVIAAGLAGCLGLFAMNTGPREVRAAGGVPAGNPGPETSSLESSGLAADEPASDPLTESVERSGVPVMLSGFPKNLTLEPGSFTTALRPADGEVERAAVQEVLLSRLVALSAEPAYIADFDGDQELNESDMGAFEEAWAQGDGKADVNGDGVVDASDFADFLTAFETQEKRAGNPDVIELRFRGEQEIQIGGGGGGTIQLHFVVGGGGNP